jgi:SAM-dependent methyltransferase
MVDVACYNCGKAERSPYASENGFSLVKCLDCGLLYVTPRPDDGELAAAHESGVHRGETEFDITGFWDDAKIPRYREALRDLYGEELKSRDRSWLDIGCGFGEFLSALNSESDGRARGTGLEPNRNKRDEARERGLDVDNFDLKTHDRRYDVISILNVYSHLPDPPEFFARCKKLLIPGGEIVIQTGDTADLPAQKHFRPFYLPDHLSFASEGIIRGILGRRGFDVVRVRKYPTFTCGWTGRQMLKEAIKIAVPGKRSRLGEMLIDLRRGINANKRKTDMFIRAKARE